MKLRRHLWIVTGGTEGGDDNDNREAGFRQ